MSLFFNCEERSFFLLSLECIDIFTYIACCDSRKKVGNDVTTERCSQLKNRLKSMAAVKYEFLIGALKAFYSIFCRDILLVCISKNAVSENKKKSAPKISTKCPFKGRKVSLTGRFFRVPMSHESICYFCWWFCSVGKFSSTDERTGAGGTKLNSNCWIQSASCRANKFA